VHLGLFFATVVSVFWAGANWALQEGETSSLSNMWRGWTFAVPMMTILLAHEFGHYFAAKIHKVPASLPYFIPMPFSPFGTWGAIIGMPARITSRRALLDIGAAGPLAGMVVAIPVLIYGLSLSPVEAIKPNSWLEGQCLLYWLIKLAMKDIGPGQDVFLHPTAFAGWAGLFITMINLLPFGQLDGGHVAFALLGPRQNKIARWVRLALLPLFLYNLLSNVFAARKAGFVEGWLSQTVSNSLFWLFWFGMLSLMSRLSGADHPPVDDHDASMGPVRTAVAVLCLVLFVLLFMPSPFTAI
jgi:membrane-associated protease RseP (regulator of RpoE activity)